MPLIESVVNVFTVEALVMSLHKKTGVDVGIPEALAGLTGGGKP